MRPPGEIRQALLDAALALTTPERSPTLLEMATKAQVGFTAARDTVRNMRRANVLGIVRERRVPYRNRPVSEYAPCRPEERSGGEACPLRAAVSSWCGPVV